MKKNKLILFGIASLLAVGATVVALGSSNNFKLNAAEKTDWKHYSAVMPTSTEQGIREYWIDCASERTPHFTKPEGITAVDYTLTQTQIEEIKADPKDERIIPTLTLIQAGVTKNASGLSANDYTFVYDAYAYNYLDSTTKGSISGANVTAINAAYAAFNERYNVVFDARRDLIPILEQDKVSITRGYDDTYGDVLEIETKLGNEGGTSQLYFYGLNRNGVTYSSNDVLSFSVYSPFPNVANTSQTYWVGTYNTATKFTATPSNWTLISSTGTGLNSDGKCATAFTQAISLQRYVNGTIEPYEDTYKMTSIIAEKSSFEGVTIDKLPSNDGYRYTSGSISVYNEPTYPGVPFFKASVSATNAADRFGLVVNRPVDLSSYSSVKFIVKGPHIGSFALYIDFVTNKWWPVGKAATPGVTGDSYAEIEYKASDINDGFSWSNLKMGLLFIGAAAQGGPTGDWYIGVQLNK